MLHSAARFCRFAKSPRTLPHQKVRHLDGPIAIVRGRDVRGTLHSKSLEDVCHTVDVEVVSSSNTQSSLRHWAPANH